jgi:hypothetical protein
MEPFLIMTIKCIVGVLGPVSATVAVGCAAVTDGTGTEALAEAKSARDEHAVPVLVAYNIPFRDCAQFSAGGATTMDEYMAWVDGLAAGMGHNETIVILEPDGLGIIPWYNPFVSRETWLSDPDELEWCRRPRRIRRPPRWIVSRC